jgi:hypothetical protein
MKTPLSKAASATDNDRAGQLTARNPQLTLTPALANAMDRLGRAMNIAHPLVPSLLPQQSKSLAKVYQFPLWPPQLRGMPNPTLRSALFAAIKSKDRRSLNQELIASVNGVEIRFTGTQLNQEDLEVCAEIFHLARQHPIGDTCHIAAHALLKALGRSTGRTNHRQLHASLIRLQQPLEITVERYSYFGSLIMEGAKDELTRHYLLRINPKLGVLFNAGWTGLELRQRRGLRGQPLALWLHAFYTSHAEPYPYKVATLRDLCGSQDKSLRSYRQKLRRALNELRTTGTIGNWKIDRTDLVHIRPLRHGLRATPTQSPS